MNAAGSIQLDLMKHPLIKRHSEALLSDITRVKGHSRTLLLDDPCSDLSGPAHFISLTTAHYIREAEERESQGQSKRSPTEARCPRSDAAVD